MSVLENKEAQLLATGSWLVDPAHSTVEFCVKHMVIHTVRGRFRTFEGAIVAGAQPFVSGSIAVICSGSSSPPGPLEVLHGRTVERIWHDCSLQGG